MGRGVISISVIADDIDFVVCHLIGQGKITVKAFFIVCSLIYNNERTVGSCLFIECKYSFRVEGH